MCTPQTTELCDNLQSIAIAATKNPEFDAWVNEVSLRLVHPAAITCTKEAPAFWLNRVYELGFDFALVANILNQRYQRGYLEGFRQ